MERWLRLRGPGAGNDQEAFYKYMHAPTPRPRRHGDAPGVFRLGGDVSMGIISVAMVMNGAPAGRMGEGWLLRGCRRCVPARSPGEGAERGMPPLLLPTHPVRP